MRGGLDLPLRHVVHLRSPWECRFEATCCLEIPCVNQRVAVPVEVRGLYPEQLSGTVILSRRFHPPRQRDLSEKIFCVLSDVPGISKVLLNSRECSLLPGVGANENEFEIGPDLLATNLLEIHFEIDPKLSGSRRGVLGSVSIQFGLE